MRMKTKRNPLILGIIFLFLFLPLVGPGNAVAITIEGCELFIGATCSLTPVQFAVTEVNGSTSDSRVGLPFAQVAISVSALAAAVFDYQYQIFDQQFAVTNFLLDLSLVPPALILGAGSIPDADPGTVAPLLASYDPISGLFSAVYLGPPITPSKQGSDILFIRSSLSPDDIIGTLGGNDLLKVLVGTATLTGPGSSITASPQLHRLYNLL